MSRFAKQPLPRRPGKVISMATFDDLKQFSSTQLPAFFQPLSRLRYQSLPLVFHETPCRLAKKLKPILAATGSKSFKGPSLKNPAAVVVYQSSCRIGVLQSDGFQLHHHALCDCVYPVASSEEMTTTASCKSTYSKNVLQWAADKTS